MCNSIDTTKMSNLIGDIHLGMTVRNQNEQKVLMYFTTFKAKLANFTKKNSVKFREKELTKLINTIVSPFSVKLLQNK